MSRELTATVRAIDLNLRSDTATLTIQIPAHEAVELTVGERVTLTVPEGWTPPSAA